MQQFERGKLEPSAPLLPLKLFCCLTWNLGTILLLQLEPGAPRFLKVTTWGLSAVKAGVQGPWTVKAGAAGPFIFKVGKWVPSSGLRVQQVLRVKPKGPVQLKHGPGSPLKLS